MSLEDLMAVHVDAVDKSRTIFEKNYRDSRAHHPLPFFGDIANAEVVTVGVNPSADEFNPSRRWPDQLPPLNLQQRLRDYFLGGTGSHEGRPVVCPVPPHPWFDLWEQALGHIGCSYRVNAAHLDISPRATIAMGNVPDPDLFAEMLATDLVWLLKFLENAPHVRLVLLAGVTAKAQYMNEFMAKELPKQGVAFRGSVARPPGRAKVTRHEIVLPNRTLPAFFCSTSPSARTHRHLLPERLKQHSSWLRSHLTGGNRGGRSGNS